MRRSASPLSIRAVRRLLLVAALLCMALPTAAEAKPFKVGTGQNGGIAMDDAGTIYVGWQVNVYEPGDAVQFCIVPPKRRSCASQTTIAFPGSGYNRSRVSVLLPAPGVVYVVEPRTTGATAHSYLARSTDGGHTFAPPVAISATDFEQAVLGPNGSVALGAGVAYAYAGLFAPDGSSSKQKGSQLGPYLEGTFSDIASNGSETLAAGSDAGTTHAFRLPAGGNPNNPAAWQQIDPARGYREPALAPLPGGFATMLEPVANFAQLVVQRLDPAGWSPPVPIGPAVDNSEFRLTGNARGRLTAAIDYSAYHMRYATSTDGGVLWSSLVDAVNWGREYVDALQVTTNSSGAGAAVVWREFGDKSVRVGRFSPRMAPVARRKVRGGRVQVRSICDDDDLSLVVEAAKGNRQVKPGRLLRSARFGRAKGAHRDSRRRYRAAYTLHRRHARIPVRIVPRHGKAHTLRLRVRGCRRIS
jgi:hypothetical protein